MKVLIIGGTFFSGRSLTRYLHERGEEVVVANRGRTAHDLPAEIERWTVDIYQPETLAQALGDPAATDRPAPTVWSPLEYACHVRDVCAIFAARLHRMLTEDDPLFANWDQDETAVDQAYAEQDPAEVLAAIETEGSRLAERFEAIEGEQWQRPGRRSDGAVFTVDSFARYFLHDVVHHGWDVTGREAPDAD